MTPGRRGGIVAGRPLTVAGAFPRHVAVAVALLLLTVTVLAPLEKAHSQTPAPMLDSATVNGTTLVLTFDTALNEDKMPGPGKFRVFVDTVRNNVASGGVSVSGSTVTLTLTTAVTAGQTVTLTYITTGGNPLQNSDGVEVEAFTDQEVTNALTPPTPTLSSATVNGTSLVLTFSPALDSTKTPGKAKFTVEVDGSAVTISSVSNSGATVTLTLETAVTAQQIVTVSYAKGSAGNPLQNSNGDEVADFSDQPVTNLADTTAPTLTKVTVSGASVVLTYSEVLDETSVPATSAYAVKADGSTVAVSNVAISGSKVTLTLASAATKSATVTYTVPSMNPVQDANGNDAAALRDRPASRTLVANTGQTSHSQVSRVGEQSGSDQRYAIAFTTGASATGFLVEEVRLLIGTPPGGNLSSANPRITINTPNAGNAANPGSQLYRFTNPGTLANGERTFTAPANATLDANTTYFIVIRNMNTLPSQVFGIRTTISDAEDGAGITDWSIADAGRRDLTGWGEENNRSAQFSLRGYVVPDTTAPVLSSATVNGASLVLAYDSALDDDHTPATSAYSVKVDGGSGTAPSSVAVSGSTVTLTLATAVAHGQSVTVSYTVPASDPVQDDEENAVAALTDRAVTNNTPDTTAPALSSAAVNGASLVLTYDEALDTGSVPAASAYSVKVGTAAAAAPSSVAISGTAVTLTLATAVEYGQTVTVSYTVPDSNKVRDDAATPNAALALTNEGVTNNTPDTTAPMLSTATVNGTALVLTYDEPLDEDSTPATSAFSVKVDGGAGTAPSGVAVAGRAVLLTLGTAVVHAQAVTVSYTVPSSNKVQDDATTPNAAAALSDYEVTNTTTDTTAPTLESATVNGASLVLTYNEALDEGSTPAASAFSVTVDGGTPAAPSSVDVSGSAVTLTLATAVDHGQTVTLTYTVPSSNKVQNEAGIAAAALTDQAVTNTTPDTTAPTLVRAQVNHGTRDLVLTYDETLDRTSKPATSAFAVTVNTNNRTISRVSIGGSTVTLRLSSNVSHGQNVTVSYTVPSTNPVQDSAGNDAAALTGETVVVNRRSTSPPQITGPHQAGKQLEVPSDRLVDEDGLESAVFQYQWIRENADNTETEISGATSRTYTPVADDVGLQLRVRVDFIDDGGSAESVTSQHTQPVLAAPGECDSTAIWCATLTVGYDGVDDEIRGYCEGLSSSQLSPCSYTDDGLTDDMFTFAGRDHTVRSIRWASVIGTLDGDNEDILRGRLHLTLNNSFAGSVLSRLTLKVHTLAFSLSSAGRNQENRTISNNYRWGHNAQHPDLTPLRYAAPGTEFLVQLQALPLVSVATVDGDSLELTFDETLDESSVPAKGAFRVKVDGGSGTAPSGVAVSGSTVTLTLATAVTHGQTVTVSYTQPSSNKLQDADGYAAASFTDQAVTNATGDVTAPTLSTATVDGDSLVLTYNEELDTGSVPAASAFSVKVDSGTGAAPSSVAVSGSTVTLTLASRVTHGQTVTVSYTVPSSNKVQDDDQNAAADLTDRAVTNNTAPVLSTATVNGASLVLTYDGALDTGSVPAASAYSVKVGSAAAAAPSSVAISGSAVTLTLATAAEYDETVTVTYTVPTTNPVQDSSSRAVVALTNQAVTNNTPPTVSFGAATYAVAEGASVSVTVTIDEAPDSALTIPLTVTAQGGASSSDYTAATSVEISASQTSGTFSVAATADDIDDDGEGVTITFTNLPTGYVAGSISETAVNITDDDESAIVTSAATLTIDEDGDGTFTVTLATKPAADVTLTVTSEDTGAATVDTGNTDASKLVFTPMNWDTAQTVTVEGVADDTDHLDETGADGMGLKVTLSASSSDTLYNPLEATVRVTVTDDDDPEFVISEDELTIAEGGSDTFTVKLATKPTASVTVTVTSDDTTAVTVDTGNTTDDSQLVFTTTNWNSARTVTVRAVEDSDGANEDATVSLSASGGGYADATGSVSVETTDNDTPNLVVATSVSPFAVTEGATGTFTVKLATQPTADVTVTVTSSDAGAASVNKGSLTFTTSTWNTAQTVTVTGVQDDDGNDENVTITLSASGGGYAGETGSVSVAVNDNDPVGLVITPTSRKVTVVEGSTAQFKVRLATQPTADVTVSFTSGDTDHVTVPSTTLTFTDSTWGTDQTVTVTGVHDADTVDESNVEVTVSAASTDALYDPLEETVSVTLDDDDPDVNVNFGQATYSVAESDDGSTTETTENEVTVTVKLSAAPNRTVVIPITTTGQGGISTTDYSGVPASLTFASTETEKTFTFTATSDTVDDDGESVKLTFDTDNLPAGVTEGTVKETTVSITDDDDPEITVAFESATYTATEGGTAASVKVKLSADPERQVVIGVTATNQNGDDYDSSATDPEATTSADYSGAPASVTFASGETEQTLTFTATDDDVDDDNEKVVLGFDSANLPDRVTVGTASTTTVTIADNDDPPVTVEFGAASYSVAESDDTTTSGTEEHKVTVTLTLSAIPEREVTIPLTVTKQGGVSGPGDTSPDYSAVPATIVFAANQTQRSFTFTATPDTVDDDGESVKLTFGATLPAGVTAGTVKETTVSINDDDDPEITVAFGSATYTVAESDDDTTTETTENVVAITVTISADPERTVTIPIIATGLNGDDYDEDEASPQQATTADFSTVSSITFNAGDTGSKTFTFTATSDTVDDDGEAVELTFDSDNLPARVSVSGTSKATVSITDDDDPPVKVGYEQASYTVAEGSTTTVKVKLDHDPERAVTIPLTHAGQGGATTQGETGADYSGVPASLTFQAGDTEKTFTFTAAADTEDDDGESVALGFDTDDLPAGVSEGATDSTTVNITDDDVPEVKVSFDEATYTAAEGGSAVTVTVELDKDPERTVTVTVSATGASSGDYTLSETSFTFNSGETEKEFTFTADEDTYDDDGESVTLAFGTPLPTRVSAGTNGTATVSITDNDTLVWSATASPTSIGEDGATSTLTVATGGVTFEEAQTIALALSGTASITDDYTIESGGSTLTSPYTLTLPADTASVTATITSVDDVFADGDETVGIAATHGADAVGSATVTIEDAETASDTVTLSLDPAEVGESNGATDLVVTATLNEDASPTDIVIALSFSADTAAASDYAGGTASLTIPAGQTSATADITLTPTADTLTEDAETVTITGATTTTGLTIESVDVTITDDDPLNWSVTANPAAISENGGTATVTISTGGATFADDQTITLSFGSDTTATSGTDFTIAVDGTDVALPYDLTLAAGDHEITVSVTGEDDAHGDPDETIELEATWSGSVRAAGNIDLNDDETPSDEVNLSVAPNEVGESDGATTLTVTGTLDGAPRPADTVVELSVTAGTATVDDDYTAGTATLTIAEGDTSATATLTLTVVPEGVDEDDETVTITGTTTATGLTVTTAEVTITDDDTRGIAIDPALLEITTNGSNSYSVVLESEPTEDVVVTVTLPEDSGLQTDKDTLTFTSENWDTEQDVTVTAGPDVGTVTITHTVSGGDYGAVAIPSVTVDVSARPVIITGLGGFGGGGPTGPTPSEVEFEWNVERDIEALDSTQSRPTGSWSDGATFWLLENGDGAGDALYAYDIETGERQEDREFKLDEFNRAPRGLWAGETTLYIADSGQDRLFAYDRETGERAQEREIVLTRRNRDARGIWSDGETMWVVNRNPSLFLYDLRTGALLGVYELDDANGSPHGVWSDGVTVWVSNHDPKRLFAYRLPAPPEGELPEEPPTLERVQGEEFTELSRSGNNSPRGIWSDGDVMYVADENDLKVYSYNMPNAIDARLASLDLDGVDIGTFDAGTLEYTGVADVGATSTVVVAHAAYPSATVAVDPVDADEEAEGHQVELAGLDEIMVSVTSADGSRERVYRVRLGEAGPSASCLRGDIAVGFSLVVSEGGSIEDLLRCAEGRHVTALYALHEGEYLPYILGAPDFVNARFQALYAEGVPSFTPLTAKSEGPPSADPAAAAVTPEWSCLRGTVTEGFSLVVYAGGSVEALAACALEPGLSALYALHEGEYLPYILGAPDFVNARFGALFPDGVPPATPLVVRRE